MPDHTDPADRARQLGRQMRAADEAAQRAQERFDGLMKLLPGVVFELHRTADGRYGLDYVSAACQRVLGVPAELALAHPLSLYRLIDADGRARLRHALRTAAGDDSYLSLELRAKPRGRASRIWLRVDTHCCKTADGTVVWRGVALNVSDRREAEIALAASEQKYRSLINMLPVGLLLLDGGRILLANEAAKEMLAPGGETLLGREYIGFVPASETVMALRGEAAPVTGAAAVASERMGSLVNLAGETLEVVISAVPTDMGGSTVTQISLLDMTDIREAERSRIRSERILRDAIESISEGFILFDAEDRLVTCNDNYRKLYPETAGLLLPGVPFEQLLQRSVASGRVAFDEPDKEAWIVKHVAHHRNPTGAIEVRRANGQWTRAAERRTHDGGIVGIHSDITETKRREQELSAAMRAAEMANRAKSEFLANMSHELRTPLNAILGLSEMIKDQMLGPINIPSYAEYGADINKSGSHLLTLINDILDLSKIEAGKLTVDPVPASPAGLVDEIGGLLSPIARQKEVTLITAAAPGVPEKAEFDALRVRQILLNLSANALKFTQSGGVYVTVRALPSDPASGDLDLIFEVSDTGIGIDPSKLDSIFEAFTQADNSTTRKFGGTGLGLAISRRLAEVMGGTIGCDSNPDDGATFWFRIPVKILEPGSMDAGDLAGRTLLLVGEVPGGTASLREHLAGQGAVVHAVGDGAAGLALLREGETDYAALIVADPLPDMAGPDFARQSDGGRKASRLMVTENADVAWRRAAHQAGFQHVLLGPLAPPGVSRYLAGQLRSAVNGAPAMPAEPGEPPPVVSTLTSLPLLVIDDNPMNQLVASRQLRKLGLSCVVGSNGREGLQLLQDHTVCMALVDCSMPEMDGFEFTRHLRAQEQGTGRHLPVVAMTANAFEESAEQCFAAGMDDFITKPVLIAQLERMLEKWVAPGAVSAGEGEAWPSGRPPPIDRDTLSQILGDDDEQMLNEILKFFLESGEPLLARARRAVDAEDAATLAADAHAAKGAARNAAAHRLADTMSALESRAMERDWPTLREIMSEGELAFAEVRAYIRSLP